MVLGKRETGGEKTERDERREESKEDERSLTSGVHDLGKRCYEKARGETREEK
jgi:hypothetical protein